MIAAAFCIVFLIIVSVIWPYKLLSPLNDLEMVKSLCIALTIGLGLLRHAVDNPDEEVCVDAIVLAVQMIMFVGWLITFVSLFLSAWKSIMRKLGHWIKPKVCCRKFVCNLKVNEAEPSQNFSNIVDQSGEDQIGKEFYNPLTAAARKDTADGIKSRGCCRKFLFNLKVNEPEPSQHFSNSIDKSGEDHDGKVVHNPLGAEPSTDRGVEQTEIRQ